MTWTILLVKKSDNGWFINYIENKLLSQIIKNKLEDYIKVIIFEPNTQFSGDYISVIDDVIELSNDFVKIVYDSIKNSKKDCIGLKGVVYIDGIPFKFNNDKNDKDVYLPVTKLNPINKSVIFNSISHVSFYINSKVLTNVVKTIDYIKEPVVFLSVSTIKIPISIIITAYKTQDYIEECLDSIEKQSYFINNDNFEVLVGVDDCIDTYNKLQQIKHKYRNLQIYMMSENKGTYITTNTLINLVKNEDVIRFDSDDVMTINFTSEVIKDKKDNDIVLLGSLDLVNNQIGKKFLITEGVIYFKKSVMDNIIGGYKPWICAADSELIRRVVNKVKISQIKKALFYRRIHINSLTQKNDTGYNSKIRESYRNKIKKSYNDDEVKIERVVNDITTNISFESEVSFIITAYKSEKFIEECLDSIECQKCKKEILIGVDSCQETLDALDKIRYKYENIRIFWFPENSGTYILKNTLAKYAKYDILSFFDSDDIMTKNYIKIKLSKLENHSIVRSMYTDFNENESIDVKYHSHGIMLINKNDFFDLNGFFDRRVASDLDFLNRWSNMKYKDIKIDEYLIKRRLHPNNISFCKETGVNSDFRNKIHEEIEERKINNITKNEEYVITNCIEIKNDSISFCIPAYKSQDYIEECLDSIQAQNCIKEILVGVDSCQETLQKIKKIGLKYKNLRIFWFSKNVGTSIVKNTLSTFANYKVISFFDSDDIMNENYSDYVLKYINNDNIIRFFYQDFTSSSIKNQNFCANGVMSIYKENFIKLNGFWKYRVTEDLDFIHRWEKIGIDNQLSVIGFRRRLHENNISYDENNGCYGEYGKKLLKISKDRINKNKLINDELAISKCKKIDLSINDYFDKIYCLNLDRRIDKWLKVEAKFNKLNLKVQRFSAVDGNDISDFELKKYNKINKYEVGCMLSHYKIIEDAKKNNYKRILIFEDDVLFAEDFNLLFNDRVTRIDDWKLFYLGATQYQWNDIQFIDDFYYSNHTDGTFAFALDQSIYDEILNTNSINNKPIDYKLWDIQKKYSGQCYTSYPNLVISDVSDSDIRNRREPDTHNSRMKWNVYNYE